MVICRKYFPTASAESPRSSVTSTIRLSPYWTRHHSQRNQWPERRQRDLNKIIWRWLCNDAEFHGAQFWAARPENRPHAGGLLHGVESYTPQAHGVANRRHTLIRRT